MSQFATAADLAARLGLTLADDEATRADVLLTMASGLIQEEANQKIALVEDDVFIRKGTTDERIALPERPVVSVASVTLGGSPLLEDGAWFLDGNEIVRKSYTVFAIDQVIDSGTFVGFRGFGWEWQTLEIVYTHGYADDAIPPLCRSIALEAVVRVWVNPGAVARETVGDTATVYDNNRFSPSGLMLTDLERAQLRKKFGRKARSITIGGG